MPGAFRLARSIASAAPPRLRSLLARAARPGVISFAIGLPDEALFPAGDLAAAQAGLLPARPAALQYAVPPASLKHRIVEIMALRGVACDASQVFLTSGAQQGMDLVARLFVEPGSEVLLEEAVYEGIQLAVARCSPRILTVPSDLATGLDVDAVEGWLARGARPRLLYAIPEGHNPLGVSLAGEKRRRLAALAREAELPILEDDAYGFLQYDLAPGAAPEPPLRALEERWVFYLGSFAKILAPALRAGWLVVPEELVGRLTLLKAGTDIDTASFTQHFVGAYLESGALPEHLERLRDAYRLRRDALLAALAAAMPSGVRWTRPASGMFVWVELPEGLDAAALLETAIEDEDVAFSPGEAFAVEAGERGDSADGNGGPGVRSCLRLCFTSTGPEMIAEGVHRLGRVVARALESVRA